MTVKERIKVFLSHLGIGQNAFEAKVGWSNGYIYNTNNFSAAKILDVIKEYPLLNVDWLITGRGEMLLTESGPDTDFKEKYYKLMDENADLAKKYMSALEELRQYESEKNIHAEEDNDVQDVQRTNTGS